MSRGRLVFLVRVLLLLAVCYLVMTVGGEYLSPSTGKTTLWLTQEKFYQYIESHPIALPNGESLTLHRGQIESLSIEPGGQAPESEAAEVSFVVRSDQGRYGVQGSMSLHNSDMDRYPIVNLGKGWYVTKK